MDLKKALIGGIGGTVIAASLGGKKGLDVGMKLGLVTGVAIGFTVGVVGTSMFVFGKNKIKENVSFSVEE